MSGEKKPSGEEMLAANMEAFENGEDLPYPEADEMDNDDLDPDNDDDLDPDPDPDPDEEDEEDDLEPDNDLEPDDDEELDPDDDEDLDPDDDDLDPEDDNDLEPERGSKWISKKDWIAKGLPEDEYLTEAQFNRVQKLRDNKDENTRQGLAKKIVQLEKAVMENIRQSEDDRKKVRAEARNNLLKELEQERDEAIDYNETEKALEADRKINKLKEEGEAEEREEKKADKSEPPEGMAEWYEQNEHWYMVDQGANNLVNSVLQREEKKKTPFKEAIRKAEEKAREYYPQYFEEDDDMGDEDTKPKPKKSARDKRKRPSRKQTRKPAMERSERKPGKKGKYTKFSDLSPEEAKVARTSAKISGLSEKEYMESYSELYS